MSMTREEAIRALERVDGYVGIHYINGVKEAYIKPHLREAVKVALTALRPVSREQVEKVWRGKWHRHYKSGIHAGNGVVCSKCDMWNNRAAHFCPSCGAPMTDETVEMVMERLEALHNA